MDWLGKFKNEPGCGTWIYRITVNTISLFNRSERRRKLPLSSEISTAHSISDFEIKIREEENLRKTYEAISNMAGIDRMLIALYLEQLSYDEIGTVLGISKNLVG